jgi:hypothetical protein
LLGVQRDLCGCYCAFAVQQRGIRKVPRVNQLGSTSSQACTSLKAPRHGTGDNWILRVFLRLYISPCDMVFFLFKIFLMSLHGRCDPEHSRVSHSRLRGSDSDIAVVPFMCYVFTGALEQHWPRFANKIRQKRECFRVRGQSF